MDPQTAEQLLATFGATQFKLVQSQMALAQAHERIAMLESQLQAALAPRRRPRRTA